MADILAKLIRRSLVALMFAGVSGNYVALEAADEGTAASIDSEDTVAAEAPGKGVPDEATYQAVVRKIEELFPDEVRDARTKQNRGRSLAEKLMKLAPDTQDPVERYVMLSESMRCLINDEPQVPAAIPLIMECADALGFENGQSPSQRKADAIQMIYADEDSTLSTIRQIHKVIIPGIQQATDRDEFESAMKMLEVGRETSKRLQDKKRAADLDQIKVDIDGLLEQQKEYQIASETLSKQPDDYESNRVAGLYLGLRRNDWLAAERHIKLLKDESLQSLFIRTTVESRTPEESSRLADEWWNWAAENGTVSAKQARSYASSLYSESADKLKGLSKLTAMDRKGFRDSLLLNVTASKSFALAADSEGSKATKLQSPDALTNSLDIKLVLIQPGSFRMGDEAASQDVTLTKSFYIGAYEVTQSEYEQLMGENPSEFKGPQNPVENVSWTKAEEFCRKLSELPKEKSAGRVYRLPTEAEWEYACRAGSDAEFSFGGDDSVMKNFAWIEQNSEKKSHAVGQKFPNAWGLFDMHGNVFEWCSDWHDEYASESVIDPFGPASGSARLSRGGSWLHEPFHCRASTRVWNPPANYSNVQGFRVVMNLGKRE